MKIRQFVSALLLTAGAAATVNADIVLFENDNFNGRNFRANNSVANLAEQGYNDRASSIVIDRGRWQICSDAFFRGSCVTLGAGRYNTLRVMGLNDKVSSIRELGWTPDGAGGWQSGNSGNSNGGGNWNGSDNWANDGNWGNGARAVLFSGSNLNGQAYVVNARGIRNLASVGFNDRASSIRVESGYWLFCSDAEFAGDCRTYGPGDHFTLDSSQARRISSGRQISRDYPYRQQPRW